jgi:hypothetical protein
MPVEVGQAGGQVVCACGTALDVPTLRQLRQLPLEQTQQPAQGLAWRPRYGAIAAFLILAAGTASVCLWAQLTKPALPPFNSTGVQQQLLGNLDRLTPAQAWSWWTLNHSQVGAGFTVWQPQLHPAEAAERDRKQFLVKALLVLTGLAVSAAACAALWPAGKKR